MSIEKYLPENIILNQEQEKIIQSCLDVIDNSANSSFFFFNFQKKHSGIYLFGNVGSGKTMILKALYQNYKGNKIFYHYQEFAKFIHEETHKLYKTNPKNPIKKLAEILSEKAKFICIDELEIRDITDAMIMNNLLKYLIDLKIFIIFTSNISPAYLYKDGIQRESFMPFIQNIQSKFSIFCLNSDKDYRYLQIKDIKKLIFEKCVNCQSEFSELINKIINTKNFVPKTLSVFGRNIIFQKTYGNVLYTSKNELLENDLSYNDYIEICKEFDAVIIDFLPKFKKDQSDILIRFINFIDNMYQTNTLLITRMEDNLEDLYDGTKNKTEFNRAISRINEMNSKSFIANSRLYKKL